jgi:hypothetical protein
VHCASICHMGEQHCCERRHTKWRPAREQSRTAKRDGGNGRKGSSHATNDRTGVRAGPQRSRTAKRRGRSRASDSPAPGESRMLEQPGQTKNIHKSPGDMRGSAQ